MPCVVRAMAMNAMVRQAHVVEVKAVDNSAKETAIESLTDLSGYYQSRYEHYLAMATEAKENKERVGLLMLDLVKDISEAEHKRVNTSQNKEPEIVSASMEVAGNLSPPKEVNELPQTVEETKFEDKLENSQSLQLKQLLQNLSQAMSAIEFASQLDLGKSLHRSYLHQILNRELSQKLSVEIVDLYLDEAINRGLIKHDEFDNQCYVVISGDGTKENDLAQGNGFNGKFKKQPIAQPRKKRTKQMQTKHRNLPYSSKLKPTLLQTVEQYIAEFNPRRFSGEDVINYLYSAEQQAKWSRSNAHKVRVSISNVLSRKAYLDKYWKRVEPGIYQPLPDW